MTGNDTTALLKDVQIFSQDDFRPARLYQKTARIAENYDCIYYYATDYKIGLVVFNLGFNGTCRYFEKTIRLIEIIYRSQWRVNPLPERNLSTCIKDGLIVATDCQLDSIAHADIAALNGVYVPPPPVKRIVPALPSA